MDREQLIENMPESFMISLADGTKIKIEEIYADGVWTNRANYNQNGEAYGLFMDGKDVALKMCFLESYYDDMAYFEVQPIGGGSMVLANSYCRKTSPQEIIEEFEKFANEAGIVQEEYSFGKSTKKSKSAKKSQPTAESFSEMVQKQRNKNRIGKSNWQDSGSVAFENLPTPESLAKSIWGDLTCLIADACDNASFNTDTEVEICAGLADDYYSRVAEALIPMLQNFIDENKWS